MRKPTTTFKWVDNSGALIDTPVLEVRPLFLTASSFDKGPEGLMTVYGDNFYKLFGSNISYVKHGQPAIQAANIIDNGGELLIKRVVAPDSLLANLILTASVSQSRVEKVDELTGKPVYIDAVTGNETLEATTEDGTSNERAMVNTAVIKYDVANVTDAKTLADVVNQAKALSTEREASNEIEGAGDASTWISVNATLEDGGEAPDVGLSIGTTSINDNAALVGEAEVGTAELLAEETTTLFDIGTILIDNNYNVFEVVADNKVTLLGNTSAEYTYPIIVVADNGRGVSSKRFNITCDYTLSKAAHFAMYQLNYLGSENFDAEYVRFSANSDQIYNDTSYSLRMAAKSAVQIQAQELESECESFLNKVSEFSGIDYDELLEMDVLFGCNLKGVSVQQITIDETGYQLNADYGMMLQGGSYGSFGEAPFGSEAYTEELINFFTGEADDSIWDRDRWKVEICLDANYPLEVKEAIAQLVTEREDFFFFRDYGLNNTTMDVIQLMRKSMNTNNKFIADYCTTYDVIDTFTKKQVPVTIMYSLARLITSHLNSNRNAPLMGILYGFTIPEAIEGTVNFIPKDTPKVDQKTMCIEEQINYASYINGVLTIETQITAQEKETQCSHINNILTVQETMRDIRTLCPKLRGSFIDASDGLEKYAQKVKDVIDKHREEYNSIEFAWTADDVMLANKIFDASIRVTFKNYVGSEEFTIYTLD